MSKIAGMMVNYFVVKYSSRNKDHGVTQAITQASQAHAFLKAVDYHFPDCKVTYERLISLRVQVLEK